MKKIISGTAGPPGPGSARGGGLQELLSAPAAEKAAQQAAACASPNRMLTFATTGKKLSSLDSAKLEGQKSQDTNSPFVRAILIELSCSGRDTGINTGPGHVDVFTDPQDSRRIIVWPVPTKLNRDAGRGASLRWSVLR